MISGIIIFAKFCKVNKIPVKDWCFYWNHYYRHTWSDKSMHKFVKGVRRI